MKKFFILAVIIAALFTIDHPVIKEPRDKLLGQGVDILSESSKVQRSVSSRMALNEINEKVSMNSEQKHYLKDALGTDEKVKLFHLRYCESHDHNLYFYGEDLIKICNITASSISKAKQL